MSNLFKIDLSSYLLGIDGEPVKDSNTGEFLILADVAANTIVEQAAGEPVKLFDLAMRLFKDKYLEVDESDADMVKRQIMQNSSRPILLKAQIIKIIDAALREKSE